MDNDGRTLRPRSPNIMRKARHDRCLAVPPEYGVAEDVGYIEVNGGGSPVVDAVEIKALSEVYRLDDRNLPSCFLGSVKADVGHLLLASGLAGFIRCVLSVYRRRIPRSYPRRNPLSITISQRPGFDFNRGALDWPVCSR